MTDALFTTYCPACGAPVSSHSATAVTIVCGYCHSLLVRTDEGLSDTGRDSALLQNFTPLQLGASGRFGGQGFVLVGRLQAAYDSGVWNEWYVLFDDASTGWLSEAGDIYVFTRAMYHVSAIPAFESVRAGFTTLQFNQQIFVASDVRDIELDAAQAEGELPFAITGVRKNHVVDWRSQNAFLTTDYASEPPQLFAGRTVTLAELALQNVRAPEDIRSVSGSLKGDIRTESCPHCGGAVSWAQALTQQVICSSCGSELDASAQTLALRKINAMRVQQEAELLLPLGSRGLVQGKPYTIIGAVRRSVVDADAAWTMLTKRTQSLNLNGGWHEYLLFDAASGFLWLVHSQEGWTVSETLAQWPALNREGAPTLPLVEEYGGSVQYAVGAFYWRIQSGQCNVYRDYRAGQLTVTAEYSAQELAFSRQTPIDFGVLAQAFGIESAANAASMSTAATSSWYRPATSNVGLVGRLLVLAIFVVINLPSWTHMSGGVMWLSVIMSLGVVAYIFFG